MLTITERIEQEIKLTTQAMMSLLLALPLPDSLLKYVSLTNNSEVFKVALVLYLDHARERIEKLCCQQHTLSVSTVHVVSHTSDK